MKKFFFIFLLSLVVTGVAMAQPDTTHTPVDLIKKLVTDVKSTVKADKKAQAGDVQHITALVEQKIMPYADFEYTTYLVMGAHWKETDKEQQQQITEQFKQLLISTFANAIAQIRNQKIVFKRLSHSQQSSQAIVQTQIISENGPIQLDYYLRKTANGWKVYDLNILSSFRLVPAYRRQFDEQIAEDGIKGLIRFLT